MITDKETIGEAFIKKERNAANVRDDERRMSFVPGLVLINLFIAIMPCPPSQEIFVCGPPLCRREKYHDIERFI
jgi:hypothetical protein